MIFHVWHLTGAYALDLVLGDPQGWPHPIRWIGLLIARVEGFLHNEQASPAMQRIAGIVFWLAVVAATACGTFVFMWLCSGVHTLLGQIAAIWIAYSTLATRSLHRESAKVAAALRRGDLGLAREQVAMLVSRDTSQLEERDILRALVETVSENISDGIVAPLFFLALGGPVAAMAYKAVNTMDSMVGYLNERYRHFGWFAARADDVLNWIPARLSGLAIAGAAACLRLDWRSALRVMRRDARKMKSPNAGFPESAAAGALGLQLGGTNIYFGQPVEKPTLGDPVNPLTLGAYNKTIVLMYATSLMTFLAAAGIRCILSRF